MENVDSNEASSAKRLKTEDPDTICSPIRELCDLWQCAINPPAWTNRIREIRPRSDSVFRNFLSDCHAESSKFRCGKRLDRLAVPRTLVCHDMKGGYLEDKFVDPVNSGNGYTFYRWAQIDVFVYFSHYLVTIPPLSWINVAHSNGVKILGTFITECKPGKIICDQVFADDESANKLVDSLIDICVIYKLDGWLINIENPVNNLVRLKNFVRNLTERLHLKNPEALVIWYDSVINNGMLKWQNELNDLNRCFFDVCDGIFVNYSWNEENLRRSVDAAMHRLFDVYVGVDIFGRNFYGGGKFNTYMAAELVRKHNLSMAIFAQGWTHETLPAEPVNTQLQRFFNRDNAFWRSLWPFLYTHPINATFQTLFYTGVDKEWFKLQWQEKQLSKFLCPQIWLAEYKQVPTLTGMCDCLQLDAKDDRTLCLITNEKLDKTKTYIHHLFNCDIYMHRKIIFYYYSKTNDIFNIVFLTKNNNNSFKKIICLATHQEVVTENCSVLEINALTNHEYLAVISSLHVTPADWKLRCYLLNIGNCKILEIGAQIVNNCAVHLCGIGFKEI